MLLGIWWDWGKAAGGGSGWLGCWRECGSGQQGHWVAGWVWESGMLGGGREGESVKQRLACGMGEVAGGGAGWAGTKAAGGELGSTDYAGAGGLGGGGPGG